MGVYLQTIKKMKKKRRQYEILVQSVVTKSKIILVPSFLPQKLRDRKDLYYMYGKAKWCNI